MHEFGFYDRDILVDNSKRAIIINEYRLISLAKKSEEALKYKLLKEKLISDHLSFLLQDKKNLLFNMFDRKLTQLVESGIAKKIVENFTAIKPTEEDHEPKQLTMDHLGIWFVFLLGGVGIAFAVFMIEIIASIFRG
jgi:hypothetical protein